MSSVFYNPPKDLESDFRRISGLAERYGYRYVRMNTALESKSPHPGVSEGPCSVYSVLISPTLELVDSPSALVASGYATADIETNLAAQLEALKKVRK